MGYRLILIDDETWVIRGLMKAIPWEKTGFEVIFHTTDSTDIYEKIDILQPDVIVTDVKMPVVSGIDILNYCKDKKNRPQIILISAYERFSYAYEALKCGGFDYIVKPIKQAEFLNVLSKLKEYLDSERWACFSQISRKLLENKEDINAQALFTAARIPIESEDFCVICLAGRFFGIDKSTFVLGKIPSKKVFLNTEQFLYFVINDSAENVIHSIKKNEILDEYVVFAGISTTFKKADFLYTYLRNASYASLQFLISQDTKIVQYDYMKKIKNKSTLYRTLQKSFANGKSEVIIHEIEKLQEETEYNIQDLLDIGNFICINLNGADDFEKFGFETLERFIDKYQDIDLYFKNLIQAVRESFEENDEHLDIEKVKLYIQEHYTEDCRVSDIAVYFHVNDGYLGRTFKKVTGKNIKDYITETKIEKSKQLLCNTNLKVYEISEFLGYTEYFYFARVFKRLTGVTPSDYREREKGKKE